MKYEITFTRYGFVEIEADSESEAFDKIGSYCADDITWSDEFDVTDIQSEEERRELNHE